MIPFQKPMASSKEMIETFNIPHVSNLLIQMIGLIPIQYRYTSNHMIIQTISTEPTPHNDESLSSLSIPGYEADLSNLYAPGQCTWFPTVAGNTIYVRNN